MRKIYFEEKVVNEKIKEVYDFSNIGLILIDENNKIIWFNEYFRKIDEEISMLNKDIFKFCLDLQNVFSNNFYENEYVFLNDRIFKVEYLESINMFFFMIFLNLKKYKKNF